MENQRCVEIFLQAIAPTTQYQYKIKLDKFLKWNKLKNYDDLLKADEKSIQRNLEDYLIYLKGKYSPNYIPSLIVPLELFYTMNDVNLNTKRLHKMFPTKTKRGGYGTYTREDISSMLNNTNKKRTKALILFLSSTGCRVGVIPELKLGHITNRENCKEVVCYAGDREEYIAFMTPEASKAFDDYTEERQQDNEKLTSESPAFRKDYVIGSIPAGTMETDTVRCAVMVTLKDVKKTKTGTRFNIPALHGLRKFFNVTMKSRHDSNLSLCEKLMGHSVSIPLDNHYGTFSTESLFEEYKKGISHLTISSELRTKEELKQNVEESENKQKQIDKLESEKDIQMKKMQSQIDSVMELLERKETLDSSSD
jgi:integrase